MESVINRKGDVTVSTVILIVLGLVVLVFLIIGLTQGWDVFFGNIGNVDPGDLQVIATACVGYAENSLDISFCQFREIDVGNGDEWINCQDDRLNSELQSLTVPEPGCSGANTVEGFCRSNRVNENNWDSLDVNGKNCQEHLGDRSKFVGSCTGNPTACDGKERAVCGDTSGAGLKGCSWNTGTNKCEGQATVCSDAQFNTMASCTAQGCTWTPASS